MPDYAAYAVLYLWGHTGLVFDRQKVQARIPDAPLDSWDLVFDPEYLAALSDCGVGIVDSPGEVLSAALLYLGHDPRSLIRPSPLYGTCCRICRILTRPILMLCPETSFASR